MHYYRAFEMNIMSEFRLELLEERAPSVTADVTITRENPDYPAEVRGEYCDSIEIFEERAEGGAWFFGGKDIFAFNTVDNLIFIIEKADRISVVLDDDVEDGLIASYILGVCMGFLLQQKGKVVIHGSCVAKDGRALVIMGDSGAGKSTSAREFIMHGWRLLTDDVTVIDTENGRPRVVPSYPSQKLWEGEIINFGIGKERLTPLWQENRKEKFHVAAEDAFCDNRTDINYALWLVGAAKCDELIVERVEGISKVDRFMRNNYALAGRTAKERMNILQELADMSEYVEMFEAVRPEGIDCVGELYERVSAMIENAENNIG